MAQMTSDMLFWPVFLIAGLPIVDFIVYMYMSCKTIVRS